MKRTVRLMTVLFCVAALLICGCSVPEETVVTTADYIIVKQGEQYLMRVTNDWIIYSVPGYIPIKYPTYKSVADMKEAILNNKFSATDYQAISVMGASTKGEIALFDLGTLYEPTLPDGRTYQKVIWYGEKYCFNFRNGYIDGSLYVLSKERFDQYLYEDFTNYLNKDYISIEKTEQDSTRGGTIYYYRHSGTICKTYMHTFTQGEKTIYVRERYESIYSDKLYSSSIWGYDGKNYYMVDIHKIEDAPTAEWYLTFGLTPYVEDAEKA